MSLPSRTAVLLACTGAVVLVLAPVAAHAHAKLVKSEPARRAALTKSPPLLRLCFNEKPEPAFSVVRVEGLAGAAVATESARVSGDERCLEVALPVLPSGDYTVRYQVLSVDGHTVKASFPFTVRTAPPAR